MYVVCNLERCKMDVTIGISIDVGCDFEREFLQWLTNMNNQNAGNEQKRIKDAVLTGYFITEHGINEYYKKHFETDFKAICEADLRTQITRANQQLESSRIDYQQLLDQSESIKASTATFFQEKAKKELELVRLENEAKVKELTYALQRAQSECQNAKSECENAKDRDMHYLETKLKVELQALTTANQDLVGQVSYFKELAESKDAMLRDSFKNETKDRIVTLEGIIQQKDAELSTLKTCNFVKGNTGESIILSFLRENFAKCEVNHTGKIAHEGDIHVIDPKDDTLIIVESKYKQAIDKNDIEKFCRDVSHVGGREGNVQCVGGIFVSLLTRNIPGKGDAHFEMIGNIPVMYVGFSGTEEFSVYFKKYVEMFNTLCKFYRAQGAKRSTLGEFLEELNFYFNMLVRNKTRIEDFKTNCVAKIGKFVADIEGDNKTIMTRVETLLKKNNSLMYTGAHCCEKCGEAFGNKRLLTKHIKTCGDA